MLGIGAIATVGICVAAGGLGLIVIGVVMFNGLITTKQRVDNAWSQIDVQLKKRSDLLPNLIETVKGYAKHEKKVFIEVTKARTSFLSATTPQEKAKASNMLSSTLKSLFAVAENYPKLEASKNFVMLQEQLSGIENKIAYARQFYNDNVMAYNTKILQIPYNFVASILSYQKMEYFEIDEIDRKPVKVKFD